VAILLVAPFFQDERYPLYLPSENLGLGYLASYLRIHGVDVNILDANMTALSYKVVAERASQSEYILVGIAASFQLLIDEVLRIARLIKETTPLVHITIGGHFATFRHLEILQAERCIDSVVRGDGEETLLQMVRALEAKRTFEGIDGVSFRTSTGQIVVNRPRGFLKNLDDLPYPARDTLLFVKHLGHPWPTQISSSRGCYGNCSFCDIRAFYGRCWRARSSNKVVDEIEWLTNECTLSKTLGQKLTKNKGDFSIATG
jgi:anaerobic magnesium-protoporphyrin IX monomethyl ester cyclase